MAIEGLNTLTQQLAKSPRGTDRCEAGCMVFDGGERKHHRDCVHYPESLTKLWHDTEAGYVAEIERLTKALTLAAGRLTWCAGIIPNDDARDLAGAWASEAHDTLKEPKCPDKTK